MMQEIPGNQNINGESEPNSSVKSHIPEQVEVISDNISKMYNQFKESEQYEGIQDKASKVKEYIKENPVPSVLASLGTGIILGLLFHRKR
ncbi:hypothetical protein OO006_11680 [Prosthecochloris sp. SCSIO W1101]|uniref:hypothetical protein n=1 Tax=Prosthecochloris sp. SCSIO W1101 TaxID=2992242 RepID=UPI00223DADCB|nr:hypothetical protein [Prosthecochloris sp. SCSIO W1101]UZJ41002.1 hypothetical protein OO006_11680 [Prosthecochloris sp. SCSIO W1101]